jgi:hypothetical protein
MLVPYTKVGHIMTGLPGAASEEEKLTVITKAVLSLPNRNGRNNSQASKN